MLEKFSLEHQVNKRIGSFLYHKATEENIEAARAKLLFKYSKSHTSVHLYENNRHVKQIPIPSILEFFGRDYEEKYQAAVDAYLVKVSKEEKIELEQLNVMICEVKGALGAHLYEGAKYRKKISTVGLISHFLSQSDE